MLKQYFQYLLSVLVSVTFVAVNSADALAVQSMPPTTTSWYVTVGSAESDASLYTWMYNKGYELGQRDLNLAGTQSNVVILHFFRPRVVNGVYGASGYNRFVSVSTIKEAVRQYARGYYVGTGSDISSVVRILIGTSNDNAAGTVTYEHGQAWMKMVNDTATAIANSGYSSQVKPRGAADVEMGYSTYTAAKAWVDGYNSRFVAPYSMYNYGDAAGCPPVGSCDNGWSQGKITYVSWRHPAGISPVPQIYNTAGTNARQWQQIALYGALNYNMLPSFNGPLTQSQACAQVGGCSGINNTPTQAWNQLWTELNNNSHTAGDLKWSTDIRWR